MSKTERALEDEAAALDELDDFVATEAAAADRAIGELIDDAVDDAVDVEFDAYPGDDVDGGNGTNGFDTSEVDRVDDEIVEVFETGEIAVPLIDDVDLEAPAPNGGSTELDEPPSSNGGSVELDEPPPANGSNGGAAVPVVDAAPSDVEDEAEEHAPSSNGGSTDAEIELVDDIDWTDGTTTAAVEVDDRTDADAANELVEAVVEVDDDRTEADAPVESVEATVEVVDDDSDTDHDVAVESVVAVVGDAVDPRGVVVEVEDDVEEYELPDIVPATPDEEGADGPEAREGDLDEVSDDVLEELRRADIDGPIVDFAPQDDTSSARRRPKRRPDYDPAPVPIPAKPPRILGRKPRVRKVTRVVRHVDPWSVFKIAAVAFMVLYGVMLTAGVLLWNVAYATGTIDNIERFFESFGWSTFEFNGGEIYHAAWIAGLFVVIGLTGMAVLTATLFNLITDIVGGMRFTVLEEEVVETRTSPMRRFVVRRPEPDVPAVITDESGSMVREAVVDDSGAIERGTR